MFRKILVANRGEIALRVMGACKDLGIKTVAVYSDADATSLHVKTADESYNVGPPASRQSYLNIQRIVEVVKQSGAEAVHPGYGLLSENSKFAEACEDENIVFIGPNSKTLQKTENKVTLRNLMKKDGIPVVPSVEPTVDEEQMIRDASEKLGMPVLIKSAFGGGGRGIRIIKNQSELASTLQAAKAEAQASFGRSEIYIEKYLIKPRHIEFQVLADKHGNVVHLKERECSIQRRFQKLVEESPSPALTEEKRLKVGEIAVKAMRTVGYANAGTVELLMDAAGDVYFNEINSRLQVEHPVTEMVTGIDIVKQQILIAYGESLTFKQNDVTSKGHAIECRINAEDPYTNFFPSPGKISRLELPEGDSIRVDTHVYEGYSIPIYYDSLIAKLIVWAETREKTIQRMKSALEGFVIEGIKTTIPLHKAILGNNAFTQGDLSTHFLEEQQIMQQLATQKK